MPHLETIVPWLCPGCAPAVPRLCLGCALACLKAGAAPASCRPVLQVDHRLLAEFDDAVDQLPRLVQGAPLSPPTSGAGLNGHRRPLQGPLEARQDGPTPSRSHPVTPTADGNIYLVTMTAECNIYLVTLTAECNIYLVTLTAECNIYLVNLMAECNTYLVTLTAECNIYLVTLTAEWNMGGRELGRKKI